MNKTMFIYIFVLIFLSACNDEPISKFQPASTPTQSSSCMGKEWSLKFHRSGGFGGFDESMTLNNLGELKVDSINPSVNYQRILSEDEVNRIKKHLEVACPFDYEAKSDKCNDCFIYELVVKTESETYRVRASDATLPENLKPVTSELSQYFRELAQ